MRENLPFSTCERISGSAVTPDGLYSPSPILHASARPIRTATGQADTYLLVFSTAPIHRLSPYESITTFLLPMRNSRALSIRELAWWFSVNVRHSPLV